MGSVDVEGRSRRYQAVFYSYNPPYRRFRHADNEWEELSRREVEKGREHAPHDSSDSGWVCGGDAKG